MSNKIYANEIYDVDSTIIENTSSGVFAKYRAIIKSFRHNPEYLENEANMLKVRLLGTIQVPYINIHPRSDIEKRIVFSSEPLTYVGVGVGWNIFNLNYSVGLDRKNNKNNGKFSFNTFSRFFAFNAEVFWMNNLRVSDINDFIPKQNNGFSNNIELNDAFFRSRSIQMSFFPNGKKMAYGNTINPIFRQIKNAGTTIFSLGYADYDFNTNFGNIDKNEHEWVSEIGINNLNLYKYEFGAGYSYNFVAGRKWVLFISDMIGVSAKRYSYKMISDESYTSKTTLGGCNYFRTGACYYHKNYFIGAHILHEFDILSTSQFLFNKTNQTAVVYIGYKFNVDGFNKFVSNLVDINIK